MKLIRTLTVAVALTAASTAVLAGGPKGDHADRMARMLDLNDEQRTQVQEIMREHRTEMQELRAQIREQRKALHASATADEFDEAQAREQADKLGDLMGDAAFHGSRMRHEIHAVLTPEQRQKLEDRHARFEERRKEHAGKHPGNKPERGERRGDARDN
mgnify:CR=1 FL=1